MLLSGGLDGSEEKDGILGWKVVWCVKLNIKEINFVFEFGGWIRCVFVVNLIFLVDNVWYLVEWKDIDCYVFFDMGKDEIEYYLKDYMICRDFRYCKILFEDS